MSITHWIIWGTSWLVSIISVYLFLTILEAKFPFGPKTGFGKNAVIMITFGIIFIMLPFIVGIHMIYLSHFDISVKIGIVGIFVIIYYIIVFIGALQIKKRRGSFWE